MRVEISVVGPVILIFLCSLTLAQYHIVPEPTFQFNLEITRKAVDDPIDSDEGKNAEYLLQRIRLYIMSSIIPGTSDLCQARLKCELAEYVDKLPNGRELLRSVVKKNFIKKWHTLTDEVLKVADAKVRCETIPCTNLDRPEEKDEL